MITKIKELMDVKSNLEELNKSVSDNNKTVSELKEELNQLRNELSEIKGNQKEFLKAFKDDLGVIHNLRDDFGRELFEFKLLKGQLQRKILDKFEEELQKDLGMNRELLKKDVEDYNELRKKVTDILSKVSLTSEEIGKFIDISRNIKKEDFELTKFARHLIEMDREKLDLMRKIDNMERLVSKIRRRELVR